MTSVDRQLQPEVKFYSENDQRPQQTPSMAEPKSCEGENASDKACFRVLNDNIVHFREGGNVSYIRLPSDIIVQFTNLPPDFTCLGLSELLQPFGFRYSGSNILIYDRENAAASAEVQMEDVVVAEMVCQSLDKTFLEDHKVSAHLVRNHTRSDTATSRLQLTSVACSWHKPSRQGWATFDEEAEAQRVAQNVSGLYLNGLPLQCLVQPPRFRSRPPVFPVGIRNIAAETTKEQLSQLFSSAGEVALKRPSYDLSTDEAAKRVRRVLTTAGDLTLFEVLESANARYTKAQAEYSTPLEARNAVRDLHGLIIPGLGCPRLYLNQWASVGLIVKIEVHGVVKHDLAALRHHCRGLYYVRSKLTRVSIPSPSVKLRIEGNDVQQVVKMRSAVEKLIEGTVATYGDLSQPLWHDFFLRPDGLKYLEEIQDCEGGYILSDSSKKQIFVWAAATNKEKIMQSLVAKIEELKKSDKDEARVAAQQASAPMLQNLHASVLAAIMTVQDSFVHLSVVGRTITRALFWSEGNGKPIAHALTSARDQICVSNESRSRDEDICVVCWTKPDDPYEARCSHMYCSGCLEDQCTKTSDSMRYPIRCLGDAGHCPHVFAIEELETALPSAVFEDLLKSSFEQYIRKNPEKIRFCPTADCPQIYRVTGDTTDFACPTCHQSSCTSCGGQSHEGLTCSENEEWSAAGVVNFQKWMEDNTFKPCPRCNIPIEKNEGCNHMVCRACSTSFCWVCLGIFDETKIYDHMAAEHFTIADDDGWEDEQGDGHGDGHEDGHRDEHRDGWEGGW
jgi:IBR domain, a half RING-finger domain